MEDNEESCEVSSSVPRKRAKRNTSIVWNTFTRLPRVSDSERSKAQCQVCKEIFVADSGTTNMKCHMSKHLDNGQNQVCASIDQVVYREKMSVAILKHNYPFSFVEHQENRKIHLYLNSTVKTISRNTAKVDILKFCNKGVVDHLKSHLSLMHSLVCDGKLFHIRCGIHILNLIVKAGLEKADEAIEKVREGVKHIKHSEGRILKFVECIKNHGLSCSKKLRQDVTTRWNSTYQMLDSALLYQQAYVQYKFLDVDFKYSLSEEEWKRVEFVKFCFSKIDPVTADVKVEKVLDHLELLFKEYLISSTSISLSMELTTSNEIGDVLEEFDVFENQSELGRNKTQLDLYLEEPKLDRKANPNLDVLSYWKENSARFILDKKIGVGQPKHIENAKILVANTAMDTDKVKIYGARVRVDSMAKVAELEAAEKDKMTEKVQKIISHGINCFVNRQLIYNFPEELFADAGILAIEHADFDGIERLALVTGGEIASTFDNPESVKLGHCKLIEEIMIGEDKLIHFSGVELGQACTIVLRSASLHVLDKAERSLHDALCVLSQTVNDSRVLLGGGWPEMVMAKAVDELAKKTPGKRSHAIEAFSRALFAIPTIIVDNAGLDGAELVAQLRAEHHKDESNAGIDVITGKVGDMAELGISEAFKS
ncbi:hypothetical protein P3S68_012886 [Capsicum galapagoense]